MLRITLTSITILLVLSAQSQNLSGTVVDAAEGFPIPAVNVLVFRETDTLMFRGTITDRAGTYSFSNLSRGRYRVLYSYMGYQNQETQIDLADAKDLEIRPKQLVKQSGSMKEVIVMAKKTPFEVKSDRMVINVKSSITSAGLSVLDVLERSPGVNVNRQSAQVGIAGKSGVRIMLNGKVSNMPLEAIFQMLSGMNSSNVEKIELITTPPSNLDADGDAGYINIVMSKTKGDGTNGSITLGAGFRDKPLYNSAANFNHRKGKTNLYGDFSYAFYPQYQTLGSNREIVYQGIKTNTSIHSRRDANQGNLNGRLGIDYQLSKKTVIGALLSGYETRWTMDAHNSSEIRKNGAMSSQSTMATDEINHWKNYGLNFNLAHQLRENSTITFDLDKVHYYNNNPSDYLINFMDPQQQVLKIQETTSSKTTPIDMLIAKSDYTVNLSPAIDMEAGVKGGIYKFNNDVKIQNLSGSTWIADPTLTANYNLKEIILAAYSSFNIKVSDQTSAKLGLRYEHTDSELDQVNGSRIVDRNYGRLFPSASLSHKINKENTLNVAYSRRITRPTFNNLAPFVIFIDPSTFVSGNSALQPAITDNASISYLYKNLMIMGSYSYDDAPIFFAQPYVDPVTNISISASQNLISMKTAALTLTLPTTLTPWWKMQNSVTGQYQESKDTLFNKEFNTVSKNVKVITTQSFTLPNHFSSEIYLNYSSGGVMGRSIMKPNWLMNIAIQRKFTKGATLRFSINDVLMSDRMALYTDNPEVNLVGDIYLKFSRRSYIFTYSMNFGGKEVKNKRERKLTIEEENRVQ